MGFTPLAESSTQRFSKGLTPGFTPLAQEEEAPSPLAPALETIKDIGRVYPIAETVGNLATQMVSMPVAGIAGLGAVATNALGMTNTDPAEVVRNVSGALTYQPHTESGAHLTGAATYPFQKLAEAGHYAGDKTLDATGSPALATVADTAINAAPMVLPMKPSEPKGLLARAADKHMAYQAEQQAKMTAAAEPAIIPAQHAAPAEAAMEATRQPDSWMPKQNFYSPPREEMAAKEPDHGMPIPEAAYAQPAEYPIGGDTMVTPRVEPQALRTGFMPLDEAYPKVTIRSDGKITVMANGEVAGRVTPEMHGMGSVPVQGVAIGEIRAREEFSESTTRARESDPMLFSNAAGETPPRPSGFTPIESTMPEAAVDSRAAWAPGANYTGFADNAATAGKLAEKPLRREDVLAPLMKDLGIRVYEGRVTGKRLGFYMPKVGAVRIKNKSDLEVAAHEIAHALDDRIPDIRASWLKGDMAKVHAEELRGVSYDKTKLYEGFAEFTRLYMTQPEKAKAAAPSYYRWFDNFTKQHENGAAIRKAQEGMTAWFRQDALARAQSKIGKHRIINEALDGMGDRFRQAVIDDLHGVYRMERQLTGKTNPMGAYETARLTRGAGGLVDGAIRLGSPIRKANGSFDFQGKGLDKILEPVAGNLDEFLMYAVGRSSHELMLQGREKLFTPAEVRSMLQLKKPEYETAFAEYQAWNKGVLDFAESMGVINKKARSMWKRIQYLPYYRVGQSGASASRGGAQGNWAGIQKLTGGTSNLRDILGNMTQNAATLRNL